MRRTLGNIISVICSFLRFAWLKLFHIKGLRFFVIERFSPNVVVEINRRGKLLLGKKVRVHSGTKIKVRSGATMSLGSGVKVNYNCIFVAKDSITIGEGTEIGPGVFIYDHDHDYRSGLKENKFLTAPVSIGKNCWIGANTVILRGTTIGDNCVIGAGSVVKGEFPSDSVIIQKRETVVKG